MKYTKQMIGEELKKELDCGANLQRISDWALYTSIENRECSDELENIFERLMFMEMGEEFEYSREELHQIARKLINNENPFTDEKQHRGEGLV